jgi:hypothetical protein
MFFQHSAASAFDEDWSHDLGSGAEEALEKEEI